MSKLKEVTDKIIKLSTIDYGKLDGGTFKILNPNIVHNACLFCSSIYENTLELLDHEDIAITPYGTLVLDFANGDKFVSCEFGTNGIEYFSQYGGGTIDNMTDIYAISKLNEHLKTVLYE